MQAILPLFVTFLALFENFIAFFFENAILCIIRRKEVRRVMRMKAYFSKENLHKEWNRSNYRLLALYFLSSLLLNAVIELLARRSLFDTLAFCIGKPWVFLYGAYLIFFTISFSLLFAKRRFYFLLVSAVWLGLAVTDFLLLTFRSMPLTASDIWLMASVRDIFEKYLSHIALFLLILGIAALIGLILFLWSRAKKFPRTPCFSVLTILLTALALFLVTNLFVRIDVLDKTNEFSSLPRAYHENGFVYCFAASLVTGGIEEPVEYSPNEVEEIIDTQRALPQTEKDTPNIVFVQLESFFDANYLKNLQFSENPVPNFEALKAEYPSGLLSVPAIGAGTANTEFEVLTGMNLNHFGVGEYPYMTIVNSTASESVAFTLSRLGYGTHAVHNNSATFYDRHIVYANLGFRSFTSVEYMNDVEYNPRGWAKDSVLTGEICKALDSTEGKDFVFAVSVQPHGKYPDEILPDVPIIGVQGAQDEARKNGLEYYLYQLKECDAFIAELTQTLQDFDEPTVVVFYGDHLPSFNFQQEELSYGNTQTTEYVIWANFPLEENADRNLQTYQLSAYVMDLCGIHEGAVFRLHQSYDYAGDSSETYQRALEVLEYDILSGEQYYAENGAPPYPTDMRFDVEDVRITAVTQREDCLLVSGSHFTPYSVVYINGTAYETEYRSEESLIVKDAVLAPEDALTVAQVSAADELEILSTSKPFVFAPRGEKYADDR